MRKARICPSSFFALLFFLIITGNYAKAAGPPPLVLRLISQYQALARVTNFIVGVEVDLDERWHVYWKNPGDSGAPSTIVWDVPGFVKITPMEWPVPRRISLGDTIVYGYERSVIFLARLDFLQSDHLPQELTIQATVKWIACEDICISGRTNLSLNIALNAAADRQTSDHNTIVTAAAELPVQLQDDFKKRFKGRANGKEGLITMDLGRELSPQGELSMFPFMSGIIDTISPPQFFLEKNGVLKIYFTLNPDRVVVPDSEVGYLIAAEKGWGMYGKSKGIIVNVSLERTVQKFDSVPAFDLYGSNLRYAVVVSALMAFVLLYIARKKYKYRRST